MRDNSTIIKEGMANLWKGKEGVGGKLYLTREHLLHKAHRANIQTGDVEIKLEKINNVGFYNNKFLGLPIKNGLLVTDQSGQEYRFVVYGREKWKRQIEEVMDTMLMS
ncbi:hypothetical protein SAMN05421676_11280 [Salinibacillus kushneri]|uniref:GRAM domain-containing protein n=1 Tax=Salinibacillus kushneri TaxID=237682 RepID=A0A1I0IH95_9BACI|nr:hypothetical protein [Salinibacillus kushneri]SET96231.1 hypothetical protein SAMN05421676_11280 [Salinibacillus kushneri]